LGTQRQLIYEYEKRNDDIGDIVKKAKALVEYYYEKGVAEGDIHPATGIFALKNFGWTDAIQINTGNQAEQLTLTEIKEQLKQRDKKSNG
jgi:hypothetical protein